MGIKIFCRSTSDINSRRYRFKYNWSKWSCKILIGCYDICRTNSLYSNAFTGASTTNALTILPNTGKTVTISGSSATSIFKLNGADYVTIDGSNNGTTSKDLTISNTALTASSSSIWLASLGTGAGATNNTIKNCNINAGHFQLLLLTEFL